jgi:hypothetical protein
MNYVCFLHATRIVLDLFILFYYFFLLIIIIIIDIDINLILVYRYNYVNNVNNMERILINNCI